MKLRTSYALKEGGERDFAISTTVLSGSNGRVERIHWTENSGVPPFDPIPGTEEARPAELVLLAMGFLGPEPRVLEALGVERDARGNARAGVRDVRRGRLRRRRRPPRAVADRLGDQRGPPVRTAVDRWLETSDAKLRTRPRHESSLGVVQRHAACPPADRPGAFAELARVIGDTGASLEAIDLVRVEAGVKVRDMTVEAPGAEHIRAVAAAVEHPGGRGRAGVGPHVPDAPRRQDRER